MSAGAFEYNNMMLPSNRYPKLVFQESATAQNKLATTIFINERYTNKRTQTVIHILLGRSTWFNMFYERKLLQLS